MNGRAVAQGVSSDRYLPVLGSLCLPGHLAQPDLPPWMVWATPIVPDTWAAPGSQHGDHGLKSEPEFLGCPGPFKRSGW